MPSAEIGLYVPREVSLSVGDFSAGWSFRNPKAKRSIIKIAIMIPMSPNPCEEKSFFSCIFNNVFREVLSKENRPEWGGISIEDLD